MKWRTCVRATYPGASSGAGSAPWTGFIRFYQLRPTVFFTISRKDEQFFVQSTGQQAIQLYPESPTKFFATVVAAQISFVTGRV
jgi:hypothetical protein